MNGIAIGNTETSRVSRRVNPASSQWTRYCCSVARILSDAGTETTEFLRSTFGSMVSEAFRSHRSADARLPRDLRKDIGLE